LKWGTLIVADIFNFEINNNYEPKLKAVGLEINLNSTRLAWLVYNFVRIKKI
jgi:hypothetical protein